MGPFYSTRPIPCAYGAQFPVATSSNGNQRRPSLKLHEGRAKGKARGRESPPSPLFFFPRKAWLGGNDHVAARCARGFRSGFTNKGKHCAQDECTPEEDVWRTHSQQNASALALFPHVHRVSGAALRWCARTLTASGSHVESPGRELFQRRCASSPSLFPVFFSFFLCCSL